MNILVLDVGTSSMRGTLLDAAAHTLWRRQIKYRPAFGPDGLVEQAPEDWLAAARALCRESASHGVDAVALTAQRSSVIPATLEGEPLAKAIMWQDTRNREICDGLKEREEFVRAICGTGINTVYSGGKMSWLRQNRPEVYARARRLFVIADYLVFHLTGAHVTDHTYGSRSMLMDLRRCAWSPELLALFGVEESRLGRLIPPSSVAGGVTGAFARETGLTAGIPVISCGGDQQCGALGQGVVAPGCASVNLGTGAYLISAVHEVPEELDRGLTCNASAIPGEYILESSVLTCGAAVDWFLRELCPDGSAALVGEALRGSPPGANGVIALPYFQGRSNPDWNSKARASFWGIGLGTTKLDLLRALLESICIEISRSLNRMEQIQPLGTLCVSGGLSQAPEIGRLLADVAGKRVVCADDSDATTRGAWMSAAHCLGLAAGWTEAWDVACPSERRTFVPRQDRTEQYQQRAAQMERLYQAGLCGG